VAPPQVVPLARRTKSHGTLSPAEWTQIFAEESRALGIQMKPKEIAEGIGILEYESSGDASNFVQGPGGHIGGLSESPTFGSTKERLDPHGAVRAAIKQWAADRKSWWPAWGRWQAEQRPDGQAGSTQWKKYIAFAEHALGAGAAGPRASSPEAHRNATEPPSSSSFGGELMHLGLVGVLVIGGVAMVGMGTTRMLGTAQHRSGA
jgi:hypothetical protein